MSGLVLSRLDLRRLALLSAPLLALWLGACERREPPPAEVSVSAPMVVPRPPGLLAELVFREPQASWQRLREMLGGAASMQSRTVGGLLTHHFGLPIRAISDIDEQLPAVAAAATRSQAPGLHLVWGIHVRSGEGLIARLTLGSEASFTAAREERLTVLTPKVKSSPLAYGVLDNHLLFGNVPEALKTLGPYLVYTLAKQPKPSKDLTVQFDVATLSALVSNVLAGRTMVDWVEPLGKPFGQPLGLLTEDWGSKLTAIAGDLGLGRGTMEIEKSHIVITMSVAARDAAAKKRLEAWPRAKARWLADVPDDSVLVATWSASERWRERRAATNARVLNEWLQAPVAGVGQVDLGSLFRSAARGRGEQTLVGLRCSGVGLTGYARGEVQDPKELRAGLGGISRVLLIHPTVQRHLHAQSLRLSAKTTRLPLIPHKVQRMRLVPLGASRQTNRFKLHEAIDLMYWVEKDWFAAAGWQVVETLQHLNRPDPKAALARSIVWDAKGFAKDASVWLMAFADPRAMRGCQEGTPGAWPPAPVVLVIGPGGSDAAQLSLRIDAALLDEARRWLLR